MIFDKVLWLKSTSHFSLLLASALLL